MKPASIILSALLLGSLCSCQKIRDKVSPTGILIASSDVEDRVQMSYEYFQNYLFDYRILITDKKDYSFIVGADSHLTTDPGRLDEMLAIGLEHEDVLYAHLGDIADTKPDYYIRLDSLIDEAKVRFVDKFYTPVNDYQYQIKAFEDFVPVTYEEITFPFYPVVGNHDITRNGWALWSSIFRSSFYTVEVLAPTDDGDFAIDHYIFLDSANGTLGRRQVELIEEGVMDGQLPDGQSVFRHTFVFSHTNLFHPQFNEFASTFSREETFFLLDQFKKWNVDYAFYGHVHTWDEREYNGVHHLTLDTMGDSGHSQPGDYLVRLNVKGDGSLSWEKVRMNYSPAK